MPAIDRRRFGEAVTLALAAGGLSHRALAAAHAGLNPAMLSRARAGQALDAGSYLCVCRALGLDPWAFYDPVKQPPKRQRVTMKTILKQAVTRNAPRETLGRHEAVESSRRRRETQGMPT